MYDPRVPKSMPGIKERKQTPCFNLWEQEKETSQVG